MENRATRLDDYVARPFTVTHDTVQKHSQAAVAPCLGQYPRTARHGWMMADVLCVSAVQYGDPMPFFVQPISDDGALHAASLLVIQTNDWSITEDHEDIFIGVA